jgi:hypothetical protein
LSIPKNALLLFRFRGNTGEELVRCGALETPLGKLLSYAAPVLGATYLAGDTATHPPRVLAAPQGAKEDQGTTYMQLRLSKGAAGALFVEFSNGSGSDGRSVTLVELLINGRQVWPDTQNVDVADCVAPPGWQSWFSTPAAGTMAGTDPYHYARSFQPLVLQTDPGKAILPLLQSIKRVL